MTIETFLLFLPEGEGNDVMTRVIEVPAKRDGALSRPAAPAALITGARRMCAVDEGGRIVTVEDRGRLT